MQTEQTQINESILQKLAELIQGEKHVENPSQNQETRSDEEEDDHEVQRPLRLGGNRRVELPVFDGDDVNEWLVRIERYFRVAQIATNDKVEYAAMALTGKALTWFEWWEDQTQFHSWTRFRQDLLKRFLPGAAGHPLGPLLSVKQNNTAIQYREEFELAARSHRNLGQEILSGIFWNGLKEEVKAELKVTKFETLADLMDQAIAIEARNSAWRETGFNPGSRRSDPIIKGHNSGTHKSEGWNKTYLNRQQGGEARGGSVSWIQGARTPTGSSSGTTRPPTNSSNNPQSVIKGGGSRRLSPEELTEREKKGLCFRCGERWGPDHICQMKQYHILLWEEGEEEEAARTTMLVEPNLGQEGKDESHEEMNSLELQLSSYSFWGLTTHKTFKTKGILKGREVIILVDPGASANFIATRLVQELNLPKQKVPRFHVEVGNGATEKGHWGCENINIEVQGITIKQSYFVMELGKSEVVLGAGWVASLGKFEGDYNEMTLSWKVGDTKFCLKGDPTLSRSRASWKLMLKALRNEEEGYLVTPLIASPSEEHNQPQSTEIKALLQEFEDRFQEPQGLPPPSRA